MRILVTGRNGQLARALAERAPAALSLQFAARPQFDLLDRASIERTIAAARPDVVVNAAAWTAVDSAERDPAAARALNAAGPGLLAAAAHRAGARLIQISTDYVFDGTAPAPYREDAPTAPVNAYGRSKLAGEEAVRAAGKRHLIVRTAWLYSPFGDNFVRTMLDLARREARLRVVGDQIGSPTSAFDLADALLAAIASWRADPEHGLGETYHLAGAGEASWAEFARAIFEASAARGGPAAEVEAVAAAERPAPAPRPANSRLDSEKFAATFGYRPPPWRESLGAVVARLVEGGPG